MDDIEVSVQLEDRDITIGVELDAEVTIVEPVFDWFFGSDGSFVD